MWTKSACVVLAWCILLIITVAAGGKGSVRPAQASTRIASSTTEVTLASTPSPLSVVAASAAGPAAGYVVQPGETLAGIAAALAVRGGWPALYAANRPLIGPDPDVIRPGMVLVLPGQTAPTRYKVAAGDTLAGIAAALAVRGGWPALYAANRRVIGPDPDVIRAGTVLRVPQPPTPPLPAPGLGRRLSPPPAAPVGSGHRPAPAGTASPTAAGMPGWLTTVLAAAGLLTGAAFLAEPVLALRRRRRTAARRRPAAPGPGAGSGLLAAGKARVVVADYHRLVVTHCPGDGTVYVLRPPGEDPRAILRAARLVLPEGSYGELADQLGVSAGWPAE